MQSWKESEDELFLAMFSHFRLRLETFPHLRLVFDDVDVSVERESMTWRRNHMVAVDEEKIVILLRLMTQTFHNRPHLPSNLIR